jgi:hypothetical protein
LMKEASEIDMLKVKFEALKEVVSAWQQTVQFNINLMWVLLAFVITAAGWALSVLAKKWVQDASEKKFKEIEDSVKTSVIEEMKKRFSAHKIAITAGSKALIPIEIVDKESYPNVFVRNYDENKPVLVNVKQNVVEIINNHSELVKIDLMIYNGELKFKEPSIR